MDDNEGNTRLNEYLKEIQKKKFSLGITWFDKTFQYSLMKINDKIYYYKCKMGEKLAEVHNDLLDFLYNDLKNYISFRDVFYKGLKIELIKIFPIKKVAK